MLCYHPKIIEHILKIKQKSKCVCFHEIMRLIIMKMEMKMKNGSHRHETNKIRSRDNECLIMMMFICIKQHLSNIWSSIYEKVKQHWRLSWKKRWINLEIEYHKTTWCLYGRLISSSLQFGNWIQWILCNLWLSQ